MGTTIAERLDRLDPGRRPELPETTGTIRLDVREDGRTEHWYLLIADQQVRVIRSAEDADLVVRADRRIFDRLAGGQDHVAASLLRNDLTVHGNVGLLPMLRRIFPGPAGARHPRELGRAAVAGRDQR
ncbi:SCP2 sterol-binding domain-containing protein [Micromonospora sp. GCM10011542]|uniref:SCP2 sterol-binding domain-containing protein n=1 Tax=Micromonospora sp. GCM10011542 TaxID=3317337 RepID=UPI003623AB1F